MRTSGLSACLLLLLGAISGVARAQALDLSTLTVLTTAQARVETIPKGFDSAARETLSALAFTNVSGTTLHGPVYVTVDEISDLSVTVKNFAGRTTNRIPYFIVSATDIAAGAQLGQLIRFGNAANVPFTFRTVAYAPAQTQAPLQVQITHPGTLITVGSTPLPIDGTINDASATLTVNGSPVTHSGGTFHANVALTEGHNAVIARAVNARGEEATATISVSLDVTAPYITIESPSEGAVLTSPVTTVTGLVNDIVRGTVSEGQANVTVNGRAAAVSNRSYLAQDVPLQEGPNTIRVEGSDQVGNTSATEVHVTYEVPTRSFIEIAGGQAQRAQIRQVLGQNLQARLVTTNGQPVTGKPVVFRVSQGDGEVGVGSDDAGAAVLVTTDSSGVATTRLRLGSRAGSGNNRVTAKAVGFEGEVVFVASATPKPADKLSVNSGNNQRGAPNQALPLPFVVVVTDDGANVIEGAAVEFTVGTGGGTFQNDQSHITATTDSDGRASAKLTLGGTLGLDAQRVTASVVGNATLTAGFTASALQTGPPAATSISGVVLDNQDHPLPNVTMRVEGTTREAHTDDQGRFKVTEVPVGPVHLIADASTTTAPGEWPTLPYNIVTVSGADNPLPAPVYMVKLDTANAVTVGAEDREVTVPSVPGFKLTVKAGSVTFPNGDRVGQVSVTPVNVSKIPMVPPNGAQPQFIVTIQPTGARFDPPAPLQLPNVDGHAPGAQVELYSFDHDLEEFVAIGLGTVSADGSVIASNPGVGVIKAGWHGGSPPVPNGCVSDPPLCQATTNSCGYVPNDADPRVPGLLGRAASRTAGAAQGLAARLAGGDTPNDCQSPICQNGGINQVPDPNDFPPDDTPHDCKRLTCRADEHVIDDSDSPEDTCKQCAHGEIHDMDITDVRISADEREDELWVLLGETGHVAVPFHAAVTQDGCARLEYLWDFHDGSPNPTTDSPSPIWDFTAPGRYFVSLRVGCAGCDSVHVIDEMTIVVVEVQHLTESTFSANRGRLDLGVGERVHLLVAPSDIIVDLNAPNGRVFPSGTDGNSFIYTAPEVEGPGVIEVNSRFMRPGSLRFEVWAPNRITLREAHKDSFRDGEAGVGAQYALTLHSLSDAGAEREVAFVGITLQDAAAEPEEVTGYFSTLPLPFDFRSVPLPAFTSIDAANELAVFYPLRLEGPLFQPPPAWTAGSFRFRIPWRYRAVGSAVIHQLTTVDQFIEIAGPGDTRPAGTMTIFQGNVCISRSPDSFPQPCIPFGF